MLLLLPTNLELISGFSELICREDRIVVASPLFTAAVVVVVCIDDPVKSDHSLPPKCRSSQRSVSFWRVFSSLKKLIGLFVNASVLSRSSPKNMMPWHWGKWRFGFSTATLLPDVDVDKNMKTLNYQERIPKWWRHVNWILIMQTCDGKRFYRQDVNASQIHCLMYHA